MAKSIIETLVITGKSKGQKVISFDISEVTSGLCKSMTLDLVEIKNKTGKWITQIEIEAV